MHKRIICYNGHPGAGKDTLGKYFYIKANGNSKIGLTTVKKTRRDYSESTFEHTAVEPSSHISNVYEVFLFTENDAEPSFAVVESKAPLM